MQICRIKTDSTTVACSSLLEITTTSERFLFTTKLF